MSATDVVAAAREAACLKRAATVTRYRELLLNGDAGDAAELLEICGELGRTLDDVPGDRAAFGGVDECEAAQRLAKELQPKNQKACADYGVVERRIKAERAESEARWEAELKDARVAWSLVQEALREAERTAAQLPNYQDRVTALVQGCSLLEAQAMRRQEICAAARAVQAGGNHPPGCRIPEERSAFPARVRPVEAPPV